MCSVCWMKISSRKDDYMRNLFLFMALVLVSLSAKAQESGFDPDHAWNTIRAEYGVLMPFNMVSKNGIGVCSLSYTRRYSGHWGWRGGVQYAPLAASTGNGFGFPLAVVYRSSTGSYDGRLQRAFDDSVEDITRDTSVYGKEGYGRDRMSKDVVANLLSIFLRRTELFAGLTPGCLWGDKSEFALSANAGITLSIPIWRFSLDFTPAFHFLCTDNVSDNSSRWFFSVSGGVSYLF